MTSATDRSDDAWWGSLDGIGFLLSCYDIWSATPEGGGICGLGAERNGAVRSES